MDHLTALEKLLSENLGRWASGALPSHFLAFGDNGTGDAFWLAGGAPDDRHTRHLDARGMTTSEP